MCVCMCRCMRLCMCLCLCMRRCVCMRLRLCLCLCLCLCMCGVQSSLNANRIIEVDREGKAGVAKQHMPPARACMHASGGPERGNPFR